MLVGAPPSAVRAAAMFGVAALATVAGRLPDPLTSLVFSAALMTAFDPFLILDLGFQLSFAATAGLVLLARHLTPRGPRPITLLLGSLAPTLAAQLATLPLILATFRSLSLIAPLTNLLIAPLIPLLMGLAALSLTTADLPLLGPLVAGTTSLLAGLALTIVDRTAALPFATLATGSLPTWAVPAIYACLLLPLVLPAVARRLARPHPTRWSLAGALLSAIGLALLAALVSIRPLPESGLRARFFDVAGDGLTLVETASGRRVLLGAAGSPLAVAALADQLPLLDRRIDLLVVTRAGDHDLDGLLEITRRYPVDQVLYPTSLAPTWARWSDDLNHRGTPAVPATPGLTVDLDTARLEVDDLLEPDPEHPAALTIRLTAPALDLRVVGTRMSSAPDNQAVVVRLAPELALSRDLRATLAPAATRTVVVGGRSIPSPDSDPTHFRLSGADVVELTTDGTRTTLRYRTCHPSTDSCTWSFTPR